MTTTTITLKQGDTPRELDFIAWKDDRISFYARPRTGKPRVLELAAPPGNRKLDFVLWKTVWRDDGCPFPTCAVREVVPIRLLAPPCRASKEEWDGALPEELDPWERVYIATHRQCLHLTKDDQKALQASVRAYNADRKDYPEQAPLTLQDARKGKAGLRNDQLEQWWAKEQGFDLAGMTKEREHFRAWLLLKSAQPAIVSTKTASGWITGPSFVNPSLCDRDFLMLCSSVRYCVSFEDGTRGYLTDCTERTELRPEEVRELRLLGCETISEKRKRTGNAEGGRSTAAFRGHEKSVVAYYHGLRYPKGNEGRPAMPKEQAAKKTAVEAAKQCWSEREVTPRCVLDTVKRCGKKT